MCHRVARVRDGCVGWRRAARRSPIARSASRGRECPSSDAALVLERDAHVAYLSRTTSTMTSPRGHPGEDAFRKLQDDSAFFSTEGSAIRRALGDKVGVEDAFEHELRPRRRLESPAADADPGSNVSRTPRSTQRSGPSLPTWRSAGGARRTRSGTAARHFLGPPPPAAPQRPIQHREHVGLGPGYDRLVLLENRPRPRRAGGVRSRRRTARVPFEGIRVVECQ